MLEKLRELWAALHKKCEEIRTVAATESRQYTEDERTTLDTALVEMDKLDSDIKREDQLAQRAAAATATRPDQVLKRPGAAAEVHDRSEDQPFKSFGEQLIAIRNAAEVGSTADPRLRRFDLRSSEVRAAAGLNETVASEGGFLVGTDVSTELFRNAIQQSLVWPRARNFTITTRSNGIKLPSIDETSRLNGSRWGGIQAYWAAEADTITATKPKFGQIELSLRKLVGLAYITDEQLEDASITEQIVRDGFAEEFAFKLDDAAIRGNGAGQPLGILTAAATVSVAKESSQVAATILYQNVSKMRARMLPRSFGNAVWFVNVDTYPQLERMFIPHLNVAGTENVSGQSVWIPPRGAADQPNGSIFGRPVIVIEQAETLGTVGDIILADMGTYYTISKGGTQLASSIHVKFTTVESAFRFVLRVDGQPALKSAITPFKGSGTLSSFVTLATRA